MPKGQSGRTGFWLMLWPLMALIGIQFLTSAAGKKCSRVCGLGVLKEHNPWEKINSRPGASEAKKQTDTINTRIVNGYDPEPRPFMALIVGCKGDMCDLKCGGSVINNRYVLTAAHCVCMGEGRHGYDIIPCKDNKIQYDPKERLTVHVGIGPNENIEPLTEYYDDNKGFANRVERAVMKVKIHPKWESALGDSKVDIALLKLDKKLEKWSTHIKPICLPQKSIPTESMTVYIPGWGTEEKELKQCTTDNRGPERNVLCRFPFKFKEYPERELNECQKDLIGWPTEHNRKCRQFMKENPDFDWKSVAFIQIWYNRNKVKTNCYSKHLVEENGWCGVCKDDAKPGQSGFCEKDVEANIYSDKEEEITIATTSRNWGYCKPECEDITSNAESFLKERTLKETTQTILSKKDCLLFAGKMNKFRPGVEVCAGYKQEFPKYWVYHRSPKRRKKLNHKEYNFKFVAEKTYEIKSSKVHDDLDYYIGYSDTCQGDSGGPLYSFGKDGKAYQYALVSRGGGSVECAGLNQPGIYTSLAHKPNLDWVLKNSRSGTC